MNTNSLEVMVDLETLSLQPNALILTIGAIKFNRRKKQQPLHELDTFYKRITIPSCQGIGMHISEETINWWNSQAQEAYTEAITNPDRIDITTALQEFTRWFGDSKLIWANGDDFDCVVLAQAYRACGMLEPWKYWSTRDVRTVMDIAGLTMKDIPQTEYAHHALYDCYRQVNAVQQAFKKIHIS